MKIASGGGGSSLLASGLRAAQPARELGPKSAAASERGVGCAAVLEVVVRLLRHPQRGRGRGGDGRIRTRDHVAVHHRPERLELGLHERGIRGDSQDLRQRILRAFCDFRRWKRGEGVGCEMILLMSVPNVPFPGSVEICKDARAPHLRVQLERWVVRANLANLFPRIPEIESEIMLVSVECRLCVGILGFVRLLNIALYNMSPQRI